MGHVFHKLYDIDMIFLRFFTVYGPGQRPDLAIHKFTRMIDHDLPLPFFGDGTTSRDYTYIDDIIDGVVKAIAYVETHQIYDIFNLGESTPITLSKMVQTIENHLGKKAVLNHLPMQSGDVDITYADITKARTILKYQPKMSFDQGIASFIAWYRHVKELGIYE
ncbi:dTDP-4-dehydro-6-deoxyglucose reductase [bioreactor metagenome]|uniref:dTDP-4-dehydro-6-deoxyglucose reductase n=1 Tax=bioreactor metagenome TaxID=1076179 RepID=A0A645GPT6_9ZZZZ